MARITGGRVFLLLRRDASPGRLQHESFHCLAAVLNANYHVIARYDWDYYYWTCYVQYIGTGGYHKPEHLRLAIWPGSQLGTGLCEDSQWSQFALLRDSRMASCPRCLGEPLHRELLLRGAQSLHSKYRCVCTQFGRRKAIAIAAYERREHIRHDREQDRRDLRC